APGALKQWDNQENGTIIATTPPLVRGNPDGGRADVNIDATLSKPTEQHLALEITNSLMYWEEDRLIVYYTNQHAHGTRAGLSQSLTITANHFRLIQPGYMGSGYGYRSGIDLAEVHAAILAKMTGRPIKTMYTREEDFVTRTHRPQFRNEMKLGINRDGTIQYGRFRVLANVGAQRAGAANGSWFNMQNLYKIPNLKLEAIDVFTNSYKSGPYRCVSHPNGTFALEMTMDKAAYAIGMDPVEFRLKNLNETGNPDTKKPFSNPGIRDCIVSASNRLGWKEKWHAARARAVRPGVFHGIGLAAHAYTHPDGDGFVKTNASMKVPVAAVVQGARLPILGRSVYRQDDDWERTAWAAHAVEVEVDTGIGSVKILKYVAAHDVGKAINPFAVEQQIEGGVVMALGAVFHEQLLIDASTGLPINANMLDYRPPSILDVPENI